ncbi:hypothetical protein [Salinibius halmophilus]|uniref:hypothetical protein n=1 Tax=Salinibius halmophilus TaxID=1853216 RepID=UPI000E6695D2|nr:hypothetical protein [Salinibius halmophilus]
MASNSKYSLLLVVLASFGVMFAGVGLVVGLSINQLTITFGMAAIGWLFILPLLVTGLKQSWQTKH